MRQAGILAAAGLIALEQAPKRLHEDHAYARRLAEGLAQIDGISIDPKSVVTNIVIFDVSATGRTPAEICENLKLQGILALGWDSVIRMVTHNGISTENIETTIVAVKISLTQPTTDH